MSKQYKIIITNQNDFNNKIWDKLLNFGWSERPQWLNDNNYINKNNIHNALSAKYNNVYTRGDEDEFTSGLTLALAQLLPEAYFKSLTLINENVQKINWESILATTTESGFDSEKNTVTTFNASSSSPSNSNDFETFTNEKASDKDISKTIDPRLSVQNIKDVSKAILDIQTTPFSGVIFNVISHPLISELFDYNLSEEDATEEIYKEIETGPRGEKGDKGDKGEKGEKGDPGTGGGDAADLGDYYKKAEIDTRFTNLATQSVSFLTNYMTSVEINRDFLNKSVTDIQDVKATIAAPKYINNSTNLPTANSNELATTEYVDGKIVSSGGFIKETYFQDKSELLTSNQPGSDEVSAAIGIGFEGTQNYGLQAEGIQNYGFQSKNEITVGKESRGRIEIGERATGDLHIWNGGSGELYIGSNRWGQGDSSNSNGYILSGGGRATFKDIIEKSNEKVDGFVATSKTGAAIGTLNISTSQFFNGDSISPDNTINVDFINANYNFSESINTGFTLIDNNTKKLNIGYSNKRAFIKVGIIVKTLTAASIGQLEIALTSGNIDLGVENIVILNPNPNAFFVKTFGILNSALVKAEGVSIKLKSQTGTFEIGGFEVILL